MLIKNRLHSGSGWPIGAALMATLMVASCTDDTYDLSKDIDSSVTIGEKGLTVPTSKVEPLTLATIMDLDDYDDIDTVSTEAMAANPAKFVRMAVGDYFLQSKSESPTKNTISVNSVVIYPAEPESHSSDDLHFLAGNFNEGRQSSDIVNLSTKIKMSSNSVTKEIHKLNWTDADIPIDIDLHYSGTNLPSKILLAKGLTMTFSNYLTMESNADFNINGQKFVAVLSHDVTLKAGQKTTVRLKAVRIDCQGMTKNSANGDWGLYELGQFQVNPNVDITGTAVMQEEDFPAGINEVVMNINADITVGAISLQKVNGLFVPDDGCDDIDPVAISSLPDFMSDEGTNLKLADPRVTFTLINDQSMAEDLEISLYDLTVTPWAKGEAITENTVVINKMKAVTKGEPTTDIYLDNLTGNVQPSLTQLMLTIPDEVRFEPGYTELEGTIELNHDYQIEMSYEQVAPLSMCQGSTIRYEETHTGLYEDLEDIDLNGTRIEMIVSCTNTIPMDLDVPQADIEVLDKDGNKMNNYIVTTNAKIKAGSIAAPTRSNFVIAIQAPTAPFGQEVERLDALKLVFIGSTPAAGDGVTLTTKQRLTFDTVKMNVIGGITFDF